MSTTTQPQPETTLASQLAELRELAGQLRRQAAQADQLIVRAQRTIQTLSVPAGAPDQAVLGQTPATVRLPGWPPADSAHLFANWEREGLALAVLGVTGWSLRLAVAEAVASRFNSDAHNGAFRRLFERLEINNLCCSAKQRFAAADGAKSCILIRLTPQGTAVLRAIGIEPVRAEWDLLAERLPLELIAGAVTLAHHARRLGYGAEVGQDAVQAVRLSYGAGQLWVAVVSVGLPLEERHALWRAHAAHQGQIAFWAPNPEARATLAQEARAFCPHVRGTDPWVLTAEARVLWAAS